MLDEYVIIGIKSLEELKSELATIRQENSLLKDRLLNLELAIGKEIPEASEMIAKIEQVVSKVAEQNKEIETEKIKIINHEDRIKKIEMGITTNSVIPIIDTTGSETKTF